MRFAIGEFKTKEKSSIIKPHKIRPGARIGIIAPAGPLKSSELEPGLEFLKSEGFEVSLGESVYAQYSYLAGSDFLRKKDLEKMFQDRGIDAIFCARGGYGSLRVLDKIDYEIVRDNPKIFVGYSDVTALLMAFYQKTGLITFHGPVVRELGHGGEEQVRQFINFLATPIVPTFSLESCRVIAPGRATGRLIGGNLTLLTHMVGTDYLPSFESSILFFEDKGEAIYKIDRMLTHLRLSGQLEGVSGVLVGQFVECGDEKALDSLFHETFGALNIPVISGFPIGHGQRNMILPVGINVELDTSRMTLRFLESYLD